LIALAIGLFATDVALAARAGIQFARVALEDRVEPGLPPTYLDLARHFVADLHPEGSGYEGGKVLRVRHADGADSENMDINQAVIDHVERLDLVSGGNRRMALVFDFGQDGGFAQSFTVLALYALDGEVRLLDAVDVGLDLWTSPNEPPVLALSSGESVLIFRSSHFNSQEAYLFTTLLLVRNDRLTTIISYFTLDWQGCDDNGSVKQVSSFRPLKAGQKHVPDTIEVSVTASKIHGGDYCGEPVVEVSKRKQAVRFKWNGKLGRYLAPKDALQRLQQANPDEP
jgi:hypothetical protein